MIEAIKGKLTGKDPARALVDIGNVVLFVRIPVSTFEQLPEESSEVTLFTRFRLTPDEFRLYGFATESERDLFDLLLSVSGVGPKLAVSIVSYISPEGFTTAVEEEDIQTLTLVPGVGRKTAERLIFELKDEVVRKFGGGKDADVVPGALLDPVREAFLALMSLGYERKAIRRVMKKLKPGPESTVEEILKAALSKL